MKRDTVRERILITSEAVFLRFGLEKTTLEDLGREAGLNKTSLYYYYPNKEEIFYAIVRKQCNFFTKELMVCVSGKKGGNVLSAYVKKRSQLLSKCILLAVVCADKKSVIHGEIQQKEQYVFKKILNKAVVRGEVRKSVIKSYKLILEALHAFSGEKDAKIFAELLWDGVKKKSKQETNRKDTLVLP